jgi:hypothetical protein
MCHAFVSWRYAICCKSRIEVSKNGLTETSGLGGSGRACKYEPSHHCCKYAEFLHAHTYTVNC